MSTPDNRHIPDADFVASLEREVLRTYRAESPSVAVPSEPRGRGREYWRVAAALILGLALGAGVPLASAQVQGARTRTELERSIQVDREIHVLRLQLAQHEHERARQAFAAGALSEQSLLMAAAELREKEAALTKLDLDLAEVRLTSAAPRDELWAPLVGGRDFVKQRLQLLATSAQHRLNAAEAHLDAAKRNLEVGTEHLANVLATQLQVGSLAADLDRIAMQLKVRDQALTELLPPAEVTRRLQAEIMSVEMIRASRSLDIMTVRLDVARKLFQAGTMTEVELRRLELDVMERRIELDRMKTEMRSRIQWQFGRNSRDTT
jgi:hypothetical protein